jgi:ubiquinone/menaquinone biosynthesis C-methylase UbiE
MHPQWLLSVADESSSLDRILAPLTGQILDIGCSDKRLASRLSVDCHYIGLDYPDTAISMYATRPDVFGDAQQLPFATGSINGVILKDVLEHVREPDLAIAEISRVLAKQGTLILWMPFMYPIHDAPYDFQRFTEHGFRSRLERNGLYLTEIKTVLSPVETAALLMCLACADAAEQILLKRKWLSPLLPVLALVIVMSNLMARALRWLPSTEFMPAFYRLIVKRTASRHQ